MMYEWVIQAELEKKAGTDTKADGGGDAGKMESESIT